MNKFQKLIVSFQSIAILFGPALVFSKIPQKNGNPAHSLPLHITHISSFGERPDWRPDGKRFVFLSKTFGDVYEYDLATGRITPCSDHFKHYGFVRVLYLSNGDFLLCGPIENFDRTDENARQKARDSSYMFVMDKSLDKPPVPLGLQCNEGPAVSRTSLKIAWTHGKQDSISMGRLDYTDGGPKMTNVGHLLNVNSFPVRTRPHCIIETQNFVPPLEDMLTVTAYEMNNTDDTETFLYNINSGDLENMSQNPGYYDEAEGIFPDGKSTLVESSELKGRWPLVDLYRLLLDGSGERERLTFFTHFNGWKASQGVISDDGEQMLFQCGKSSAEAGQGFGLFLYNFSKAAGNQ